MSDKHAEKNMTLAPGVIDTIISITASEVEGVAQVGVGASGGIWAKLTGKPRTHDPEEAYEYVKPLLAEGAQTICASLGHNGAIFVNHTDKPLYIIANAGAAAQSAVGSGDAMVGAIAHAYSQGMSYEETAKFAVAMGTASAKLPGTQMATMKEAYEVYETLKVYTL